MEALVHCITCIVGGLVTVGPAGPPAMPTCMHVYTQWTTILKVLLNVQCHETTMSYM